MGPVQSYVTGRQLLGSCWAAAQPLPPAASPHAPPSMELHLITLNYHDQHS